MKISRWLQQKANELARDPFAMGTLFKVRCFLVLNFIYRCFLWDLRNYYDFKAWFFAKKAAFLYAVADVLESWARYRRRKVIRRRLKRCLAGSGKGAQRG